MIFYKNGLFFKGICFNSTKKYVVAFEPDIKKGICYLARFNCGFGEVATFNNKVSAENWVKNSEDIDNSIFNTAIIEVFIE
jgi:hypothetical protein